MSGIYKQRSVGSHWGRRFVKHIEMRLELIYRTIASASLLKTDTDMTDRDAIQSKAPMRFGNRKILCGRPMGTRQTRKRRV